MAKRIDKQLKRHSLKNLWWKKDSTDAKLTGKWSISLKWEKITDADNNLGICRKFRFLELTEAFLNSQKADKEKHGTKRKSLSDRESKDSKSKKRCILTNQEVSSDTKSL